MNELFSLVNELRRRIEKYGELLRANEALTRYVLIDPLLRALGWDTENPDVVRPEERQGSGRPDYVLYHNGRKLIALEAKSLGTKLDEKGILDLGFKYSWREGTPYFIVTDGNTWRVYNIYKPPEERLVLEINISEEPIEDVIRKLLSLWKPLVGYEVRPIESVMKVSSRAPKGGNDTVHPTGKILTGPINSKLAEWLVLYVLHESNRPMRRKEIVERISKIVKLTDHDKEVLKSGRIRWEATVRWAISNLGEKGLIERVKIGVWKITKLGILKLKNWKEAG